MNNIFCPSPPQISLKVYFAVNFLCFIEVNIQQDDDVSVKHTQLVPDDTNFRIF